MDKSMDLPDKLLNLVINPWILGADPEWAVIMPPNIVVPNSGKTAVSTSKSAGAIGSDHGGRVWELRPAPSSSAYVVASNLCKLLNQPELNKVETFKWKSGALGAKKSTFGHFGQPSTLQEWIDLYSGPLYAYPLPLAEAHAKVAMQQQAAALQASIQAGNAQQMASDNDLDTLGGHVHFGIAGLNPAQRQALNHVTTGLLNLDVLPQKENLKRLSLTAHMHPKYGHFDGGDAVRDCNGHVEYRCAPSWLDKPGQALAALTVYKLAAARPSSVKWPESYTLKTDLLTWLDELSSVDVDAWILSQYVDDMGFEAIQADPSSDFKGRWRRENPWEVR